MRLSDKIFILPILLLGANLVYRIIDSARMITTFPLDYVNDLSAYVSLLHFLDVYGFLQTVPNWYNGFTLFQAAAPGWYFFTLPIYKVLGDIMLATFVSILLLYILGFVGVWGIGKLVRISKVKRLAFFFLLFANPMLIGGILRQGRLPEFAALVLVVYILWLALYLKENKVGWKVLLFVPLYGGLILTHQPETVLASTFLLGLLLVKDWKDRLKIIGALSLGVLLSSFWLLQFVRASSDLSILETEFGRWLLDFSGGFLWSNVLLVVLPIGLVVLFGFYLKGRKKREEVLFFSPVLVLAGLVLTRLIVFFPVYQHIYLDPWQDFFMLFTVFFLVSIKYNSLSKKLKKLFFIGLILVAIAAVSYNMVLTPMFQSYTQTEVDILAVLPEIEGRYLFLTSERIDTSYPRAYYGYTAIFLDKDTAGGWGDWFKSAEYNSKVNNVQQTYRENHSCEELVENAETVNVTEFVSLEDDCTYLVDTCGFTEKAKKGNACLVYISGLKS